MNTEDVSTMPPMLTEEFFTELINKINTIFDFVMRQKKESELTSCTDDSETFLKVKQVAELTKYAEQTVRTKTMLDEIPSFKMNGKRLYRKSDILDWMGKGGKR